MRLLIVGYGSIGRRHFRNLLELGERDIQFYRTDRSSLDDSELNGFKVYQNLNEALAQNPDGVIVANPTAFHLSTALLAARQGSDILIEKPISHSWDGVEKLSRIAAETGSRVLVGYQFRYHPNLLQIKSLLENGGIGKPLEVRSHWGEYLPVWHPWEDYHHSYSARKELGGGVLLTLSHPFDYLRFLFGNATVQGSVLGYGGGLGIDVEDMAEVLLKFDDQLIGSVHLNYLEQPPRHTLNVIGTQGKLNWNYYQNRVDVISHGEGKQIEEISYFCPPDFDRNHLFLREMEHFLEIIQGNASPVCTLDDGMETLRLIFEAGT
jgi:predicted dehydrogenase